MISVGYLSQSTLKEFGPPPEADPRPETCWRTNFNGGWVDSHWLYEALIGDDVFLADDWLQETFLDYIEKQVRIEFYNYETHEFFYAPIAKRGNLYYTMKKGAVRDEISEAMSGIIFDEPVPGFRNLRRTRLDREYSN